MINAIKKLLGLGPAVNLKDLMNEGAIIVDVRTKGEYAGGHVKGSVNIPLQELQGNLKKLKNKEQPIITCCASGMRSASAKGILKQAGYTRVHNGGSWMSVHHKIKN